MKMSLCLRTFPSKFTSFVNTRKGVTKIDRRLPKHVRSSLFLEEFLDIQTTTYVPKFTEKPANSVIHSLNQNVPFTFLDFQTEMLHEHKQKCTPLLNRINFNASTKPILNELQCLESCHDFNYFDKSKKHLSHSEIWIHRILDSTLVKSDMPSILYADATPSLKDTNEKQSSNDDKPSEEQLQSVYDSLSAELPSLFVRPLNYTLYSKDIIFINNIRGVTTKGIEKYVKQIIFLKLVGHLKYAYVKLDILKITLHPEDSSIKVRWRIVGISGTKVFFLFWKMQLWNIKNYVDSQGSWYDGFSTFYVNNEGKINKHVADKLMPDQDSYRKMKDPVVAKLAAYTALLGLDTHYFMRICSKLSSRLSQIK